MTELEQLIREIDEWQNSPRDKYDLDFAGFSKELSKKYSVTLRNSDSSADNNKIEQSTTDEELVSKIETMLFNLSTTMIDDYYGNEVIVISGKNKIAKEIAKLFKTYQNSVLRQDLNQVSKYSNRGETESKIAFKNSLRHHVGKLVTADQELDQIVENIVNFFVDTVNPVFRALNDSDEQSIIK